MDTSAFAQGDGTEFFKFILEETICEGKLMLPRKFAAKHGNSLPSLVTLEIPTGARWQVEVLKKSTKEIWFDKGWKEFAQDCFLGHGYILVFRYDKKRLFLVQVFEETGLEADYPEISVVVDVKMEQEEDCSRCELEMSGGKGVKRASEVKMEEEEVDEDFEIVLKKSTRDQVKRPSKLKNEKARESVKNEIEEIDVMEMNGANRVKRASEVNMKKDGGKVNVQPILRRSARKQAESASKPNNLKTSDDEDEDEMDNDSEDEMDSDSEDEDYVRSTEDEDESESYVENILRKSGGKQVERAPKPNNGRTENSGRFTCGKSGGEQVKRTSEVEMVGKAARNSCKKQVKLDVMEEDIDSDYMKFLHGMNN